MQQTNIDLVRWSPLCLVHHVTSYPFFRQKLHFSFFPQRESLEGETWPRFSWTWVALDVIKNSLVRNFFALNGGNQLHSFQQGSSAGYNYLTDWVAHWHILRVIDTYHWKYPTDENKALMIPDEKYLILIDNNFFNSKNNAVSPIPSTADGAP